jgi:hypothetical protein
MSSLTGHKKLFIAVILTGALIAGSLAAATSFASAQNATTSLFGNNSGSNSSNSNNTTRVGPGPFAGNVTSANNTQSAASSQIVGSINVKQEAREFIKDKVKVTLAEASTKAESQVSNGKAVTGRLCIVQGFLVYTITLANMNNGTVQKVIVDAGNGNVLYASPAGQTSSSSVLSRIDGTFGDGTYYHHYHHHHHRHYD